MTIEQTIQYRGISFTVQQRTTNLGSWFHAYNPIWQPEEGDLAELYRTYEEAVEQEKRFIDAILGPRTYRRREGRLELLHA